MRHDPDFVKHANDLEQIACMKSYKEVMASQSKDL